MGLLDKLKSLFGSDQKRQSPSRETDADVTVEHEPAAGSEHAVKGTDTGRQQTGEQQGQPPGGQPGEQQTADATEAGATPAAEPASAEEPTAAAEPEEPEEAAAVSENTTAESPSVEEIKGIGPTYAERLEGAGISTVADLAAADPAEVAEAAQTGENRAGDWVERAQHF